MNDHATATGAETYLSTWSDAPAAWFTRADRSRLRYIVTGDGPPLVLLHTVRTQLDYFQRLIPLLTSSYRVYAVDFPGMGWSDIIPGSAYNHDDLLDAISEFIIGLDLHDATLVGESMGSVIALTAAAKFPDRISRVVASNTYDYKPGLERANALARVIIPFIRAPFIGPVFASLENKSIVKGIVGGGYADRTRLPEAFVDELVAVGARPGYPGVARAIYRNLSSLAEAKKRYAGVTVPVDLIYSSKDWSRRPDQQATIAALGSPTVHSVPNAGHFTAMERPEHFASVILGQ